MCGKLVVPEKDHEVRKITLVLAKLSNFKHEIHAKRVASQRKEEALSEAKQPGKAPKDIHPDRQNRVGEVFAIKVDRKIGNVQRIRSRNESVQSGQNT
jgi:hypothetical protein